jgi:hypothetical protein
MSIIAKLTAWLPGHETRGEAIARLVLAAREDAAFRWRLESVLRLPSHHRQSLLNDAVRQMTLKGEPEDLRAAFSILATDDGAAIALKAINQETP